MEYTLYIHSSGRILQNGFSPQPEWILDGLDDDHRLLLGVRGDPDTQKVEGEELVSFVRVKSPEEVQAEVLAGAQARLDGFAATRNYDGILSACTYATSSVPQFAAEGQYAVEARDQTWAALYRMLAQVQAGMRPVPASFEEIEADLPVLAWPAG